MNDERYTPPQSTITYDDAEPEYAGFWRRTIASIIDTVVLLLVMVPVLWVVFGADYFLAEDDNSPAGLLDILLNYLVPVAVTAFFWMKFKATPGKMIVGCQVVVAETGEALTLGRSILRYVGYLISSLPLFLGFVWVVFDKRKQGWHDKIAGTVVIRRGTGKA